MQNKAWPDQTWADGLPHFLYPNSDPAEKGHPALAALILCCDIPVLLTYCRVCCAARCVAPVKKTADTTGQHALVEQPS